MRYAARSIGIEPLVNGSRTCSVPAVEKATIFTKMIQAPIGGLALHGRPTDGSSPAPCQLIGHIPVSVFTQSPSGSLPKRASFHKTTVMHYLDPATMQCNENVHMLRGKSSDISRGLSLGRAIAE